jgi:predicted transposase YdaD
VAPHPLTEKLTSRRVWHIVNAMEPSSPHDAVVKRILADPRHARGELRHLLPPDFARRCNFRTLRLCPGSVVDEKLKSRHTDLLFTVRLQGNEVLLYLLLEHQSRNDALMPFRMLVYMVRVWERYLHDHPRARRLPALVPMVLHHSRKGWSSPTSFHDLFALDAEALSLVSAHLPSFRFLLDDISAEEDASLRARAMSALSRLMLFCLRHARDTEELLAHLAEWNDLFHEVRSAPGGMEALAPIWRYILVTGSASEPEDLVERLVLVVGNEAKEEIVTAGEMLEARGRKKGAEQQSRNILLRQLQSRFGAVPKAASARVQAATPDQLERWLDQVLTAATLSEALAAR